VRVLITGGTGFIGRALVPVLRRSGFTVVVWTRSAVQARMRLGADVETVEMSSGPQALTQALERCDAVINLAGEPIMGKRWSPARRRRLRDSRVTLTERLVAAIGASRRRPRVLVSGSAVGYYGDRANEVLSEEARPGSGFLAELCQQWEAAAQHAEHYDVRVAQIRTGVVLGRDGGALAPMLIPFRLGVGGPIGTGRQYLPWIHLHDLVAVIVAAATNDQFRGPINAAAPNPVTNREFARALGRTLRRPALLPVPAFVLRLLFGEAAVVLLGSQRTDPAVLRRAGFSFAFPTIDDALADILSGASVAVNPLSGAVDGSGDESGRRYLLKRPPAYELRTTTVVKAPVEEAFAFFSKAENLGMLTPTGMRFSIRGLVPEITDGARITYRMRVGSVPLAWQSRILNWKPGERFVDVQERGPYKSWYHEHSFRSIGSSTMMQDRVYYAPPLGFLGRLANRWFIVPMLRRIFQYRADVIRLRFGAA
jgi:uncharacterized protein (TIGR01777 family)